MSITVERRYRVTTNGTESDMSEDEARALAFGLLTALGIAPAILPKGHPGAEPAERVGAAVEEPAQLPSGPVAEEIRPRGPRSRQASAAYEGRMRALIADGLTAAEVAAAMGVPKGTVQSRAHRLGLKFGNATKRTVTAPEPPRPDNFPPPVGAGYLPQPVGALPVEDDPPRWVPDGGWTFEQTKALIRAMAPGHGGIREAAETTGHSMGGCGLRWKHLKTAGIMTVEKYLSSPERVA